MSDPVLEATQRAWPKGNGGRKLVANRPRLYMQAAAREMAKPIRELHRPVSRPSIDRRGGRECAEDGQSWPCKTAKLVYTTEELTAHE